MSGRIRVRALRTKTGLAVAALVAVFTAACAVGPNYKRPPVITPDVFRSQTPTAGVARDASLADERWSTVFDDEVLRRLIATALAENFDLQIGRASCRERVYDDV